MAPPTIGAAAATPARNSAIVGVVQVRRRRRQVPLSPRLRSDGMLARAWIGYRFFCKLGGDAVRCPADIVASSTYRPARISGPCNEMPLDPVTLVVGPRHRSHGRRSESHRGSHCRCLGPNPRYPHTPDSVQEARDSQTDRKTVCPGKQLAFAFVTHTLTLTRPRVRLFFPCVSTVSMQKLLFPRPPSLFPYLSKYFSDKNPNLS